MAVVVVVPACMIIQVSAHGCCGETNVGEIGVIAMVTDHEYARWAGNKVRNIRRHGIWTCQNTLGNSEA